MSWRDRARPVAGEPSAGWRDRARSLSREESDALGLGEPSAALSAVRGLEQGLTLGFADEALGFIESRLPSLKKTPRQFLRDLLFDDKTPAPPAQTYQEARDENRALFAAASEANPASYGAGGLAGGLLAARALPGAGKSIGSAVASGAAFGGAAGLGGSEADILDGDVGGTLKDVALSAGLGGGLGGALSRPVLTKAAQVARPVLDRFAAKRAVKATGAIQSDIKGIPPERLLEQGRMLLEQGVVPKGASKVEILKLAEEGRRAAGSVIGDVLRKADATAAKMGSRFNWGPVLEKMANTVDEMGQAGREALAPEIKRFVYGASRQSKNDLGFTEAHKMLRVVRDSVNWQSGDKLKNNFLKRLQGILNEEIETQVQRGLGGDIAQEYKAAKSLYGAFKLAKKGATRGAERETGNQFFGLTDKLAGVGAGGVGGLGGAAYGIATGDDLGSVAKKAVAGAALLGGSKFLREKGSGYAAAAGKGAADALRGVARTGGEAPSRVGSAVARGLQAGDSTSQERSPALRTLLESRPEAFGKYASELLDAAGRGEQQLAATHYVLFHQAPEYRQRWEELMASDAR
jgi:hypothetical protein